MEIADLKGKKITVMGLGLHGGAVGVIKFLAEAGAELVVTDLKSEEELKLSLEKLKAFGKISYALGRHEERDFSQADMIIKNPAVPWNNKYIQTALKNNIPVEIDSSLFFKLCKNKIIGVVTAKQVIKLLSSNVNKWIKANLIYTQNPITVSADESVSNARRIMTTKRIDHLPVLNQGKIKQVLTSYHILQSIMPSEKQGRKSMVTKTEHALELKIGTTGSTRIPQCSANDDLNKIINSMLKANTTCCLVNLQDTLQGIITFRDILG